MERKVSIYYARTDAADGALFEKYLPLIEENRRERIGKSRSEAVRKNLLVTGALLYRVLSKYGCENGKITYEEKGKPRIPGLCFNISHSGTIVGIAVSNTDLGFDLQKLTVPKDSLLKRILSEGDGDFYNGSNFTDLWALKESYSKLTGEGIATDFTKVSFKDTKEDFTVLYDSCPVAHARLLKAFDDYSVSVCMKEEFSVTGVEEIDL